MVGKILIDHNTKDGFEAIAHARQYMLELGIKELEDSDIKWPIRGSHVLAPVSVHFYSDLILSSHINFSVLTIRNALYFIRSVLPSSVVSLSVCNVPHLFVLPNVLASDLKTYNFLML